MSIKEIAKRIKEEAEGVITSQYGEEKGFELYIGQKNIKVSTYTKCIELKRWYEGDINHHFYTVISSWYYVLENKDEEILIKGLEYAFEYLKEYANFKKMDGFVLVEQKDSEIQKQIFELVGKVDKTTLSDDEKKYAAKCFNYYAEKYIAGQLSENLEKYLKDMYKTADSLKKVSLEYPLCVLKDDVYNVMSSRITMQFHGEEITVFYSKKDEMVHVECERLNKDFTFIPPLGENDFNEILKMIEEENKIRNLVSPTPVFFSDFFKKIGMSSVKEKIIKEEFENVVSYFDQDWERVELLYKDCIGKYEEEGERFLKKFIKTKDSVSSYELVGYRFDIESYTFWILNHPIYNDKYKKTIKIFITKTGEKSIETEKYVSNFFVKLMEINL